MSFVSIDQPSGPPGRPQPYIGQPFGGPDIGGDYAPIRTTPGRATNATISSVFPIRPWEQKYHEHIRSKQPVFTFKSDPEPETDFTEYVLLNLPMLNFTLAQLAVSNSSNGVSSLTVNKVMEQVAFLGINVTEPSEHTDAHHGNPVHTIEHQGESTMYNIFQSGVYHGRDLYFIVKRVNVSSDPQYILSPDGSLSNIVSMTDKDSRTVTSIVQVFPYACNGQIDRNALLYTHSDGTREYGKFWRVGRLHRGIYMEYEGIYNRNSAHNDLQALENNKDMTVFLNPS